MDNLRDKVTSLAAARARLGRRWTRDTKNSVHNLIVSPWLPLLLGPKDDQTYVNWCAIWGWDVLVSAGVDLPKRYREYPLTLAHCNAWKAMAMGLGAWRNGPKPPAKPGDPVLLQLDRDRDPDHFTICLDWMQSNGGVVRTAEGNSGPLPGVEAIKLRRTALVAGSIDLEILAARFGLKPQVSPAP